MTSEMKDTTSNGDNEVSATDISLKLKEEGNDALSSGLFTKAIQCYSEGLRHSPENVALLCNRAFVYIKTESYGLAIQDSTAAIAIDATYAKAYYRRGTAQFALDKVKAARKDFRHVCKLKPKDRDARAKVAACEKFLKEKLFAAAIESEATVKLSETYDPNLLTIDEKHGGPHPSSMILDDMESENALFQPGALPLDFVMATVNHFKNQKLIHKRYVARILISAKRYLETLPSLLNISIPESAPDAHGSPHITVCGDTHGQFYDVLNIFDINGYPSSSNPYLFNGDFVDRGSFSVEVILTYLLFKLSCPESIHLLRGNHETRNMNKIYGFEGEVKHKYDDKIFNLFLELFCELPLAAVIEEKVFVTHGGLSTEPNVSLQDIKNVKRGCEPPEKGLMSDLLWSDPQPFPGRTVSKRGVGFSFGPDITEDFLLRNNLKLLVRSHEVKDEGYLVEHSGKTITIFSAPNYCDSTGNKGAFIHFDKTCEPKFTQFEAVPHPDVKPMAYAAGMSSLFM